MSESHHNYVQSFLDCVAPGETQFVFQAIRDLEPRTAHSPLVGTLAQHHAQLLADNAAQHGIYWQVNPGASRAYAAVTSVRALFLDFDTGGLPDLPLQPHCVVETSEGRFQAYWRVSDCSLDDFDPLLDALVQRWGSDSGAKGRNRLFRLPGFLHHKRGAFTSAVRSWLPGTEPYTVAQVRGSLLAGWVPPVRAPRERTYSEWDEKTPEQQAATVQHLREALSFIPNNHPDRETNRRIWIAVGQALACLGDLGMDLWDEWSQGWEHYQGRWSLERAAVTGDRTGYAAIFTMAAGPDALRPGYVNPASREAKIAAVMSTFGLGDVLPTGAVLPAPPVPAGAPPAPAPPTLGEGLTFTAAAAGAITASIPNVVDAMTSNEGSVRIAYDQFQARPVVGEPGTGWRPLRDADLAILRCELERRGFKAVGPEIMKSSVAVLGERFKFDSAIDWANGLQWDGVPRVTMALNRFYGVEDSPYTRAVSEYLFTALAGRCLDPGCQADMVPILIGAQGARKTSAIIALAPTPDVFVKINLGKRDEDLSRRLRGKLVAELPELRGLTGRDIQGIRDWVTNRTESLVDKYQTYESTYPRRFIGIGTSNEDEILDDPEGERRWLPMRVHRLDVEGLVAARDQLWAEGVAMWRAGGIRWEAAERLARDQHGDYKILDDWQGDIEHWLAQHPKAVLHDLAGPDGMETETGRPRGEDPFTTRSVLVHALRIRVPDIDKTASNRVAKILRGFGYVYKNMKIDGKAAKRWVKGNETHG